jgi:anti-anti-sigma factor
VLAKAQAGVCTIDRADRMSPERLRRFFLRGSGGNEGMVRVRPELAAMIRFQQVILLDARYPVPGPFREFPPHGRSVPAVWQDGLRAGEWPRGDGMILDRSDGFANTLYLDRTFETKAARLLPGEFHVTGSNMVLVTVPGSCVSACIRDARTCAGGMNLFMLPEGGNADEVANASVRYGPYAMEVLINTILKQGANNAAFLRAFPKTEGIPRRAEDLEDIYPRKVCLFPRTEVDSRIRVFVVDDSALIRRQDPRRCSRAGAQARCPFTGVGRWCRRIVAAPAGLRGGDGLCRITVKEAQDGERVLPGHACIAPGHSHLLLRRSGANCVMELSQSEPVNRHRPSVDVLFRSAASRVGRNAVGVNLTGMGRNGAAGMREMHDAGSWNVAQDEDTCVVVGMPEEAINSGGVDEVPPLKAIARAVIGQITARGGRQNRVCPPLCAPPLCAIIRQYRVHASRHHLSVSSPTEELSMQTQVSIINERARISLSGRFDFNAHRTFKSAYEGHIRSHEVSVIEIDLGNVDYLDSAALGMLLLLRDQASTAHKTVILSNCRGVVQQILDIANFKKLFTIQ